MNEAIKEEGAVEIGWWAKYKSIKIKIVVQFRVD